MKFLVALAFAAAATCLSATGALAFTVSNLSQHDIQGLYFGSFPPDKPTDDVGSNYLGEDNTLFIDYHVNLRGSIFEDDCGVYDMAVDPTEGPMVVLFDVDTCEDSFDIEEVTFTGD